MQADGNTSATGVFGWLGNAFGTLIRYIVEALQGVFGGLSHAVQSFLSGLAGAVGMSPSIFNYAWLVLGLILLFAAIKAAVRGALVAAIIWAILGIVVLGSLIGEGSHFTALYAPGTGMV